jgi:ankyrin repeat protein
MKNKIFFASVIFLSIPVIGMEKENERQLSIKEQINNAYKFMFDKNLHEYANHAKGSLFNTLLKKDSKELASLLKNAKKELIPLLVHIPLDKHDDDLSDFTQLKDFFKEIEECKLHDLTTVTPLGMAIFMNDQPSAQVLLDYKADPNYFSGAKSAVEIAVSYQPHNIPFLIAAGAAIEAPGRNHKTPIFIPCVREDRQIKTGRLSFLKSEEECNRVAVQELIKAKANLTIQESLLGLTPLHVACNNGKYEVAKLFLDNGVPVDIPDKDGDSPIQWSIMNGQGHIVALLLKYGANVKQISNGKTLIDHIVFGYASSLAMELLRHGAAYPASEEHKKMIHKELESYSGLLSDSYRKFLIALITNQTEQALNILNAIRGNELNTTDHHGYNYLHWAVVRENTEVVQKILDLHKQATTSKNNIFGYVVGIMPIIANNTIEPLDLHSKTRKSKRTALEWAKYLKNGSITNLLTNAGATE